MNKWKWLSSEIIIMIKLKNNAPLRSCISKINSILIDNAEDLVLIMQMYRPLEYGQIYFMKSGRFWNYYRDEIDNINDNASDGKWFNYKTKIVGKTTAGPGNEVDAN